MKNKYTDSLFDLSTTETILESISDGVFTVNPEWKIMSFNRAAEEITGVEAREAIGKKCWEVFRSNMCKEECALKKTMKEGRDFVSSATHITSKDGRQVPITVSTSLLKDHDGRVLGGVETFRDHTLVEELRKKLSDTWQVGDIISRCPAIKEIFNVLPQISESDSTVVIGGETGTGKELMAKAIHNLSHRRDEPFVAINCGALPDSLLESELFGYKAGAFTHAIKDKPGLFSQARGGTIFLDEIGDTSPAFQVRLLRVLEAREFQPLGGVKKEVADVRIISASNKNLEEMVADHTFRQDLYYRLNVVQLNLPPLRERMEDIPLLVDHFISRLNALRGKYVRGMDRETLALLMAHTFPGNVRELENIIEHAFVLCCDGDITVAHLPGNLALPRLGEDKNNHSWDPVKSAEFSVIMTALEQNNYNRKAAAETLGMHKSTLFRKINRLGITLPSVDGRSRQQP
jgi:PAS domain S-box-containing protein